MGLLSVKLRDSASKGFNVPAYQSVTDTSVLERLFENFGRMKVISDIGSYDQHKLVFDIEDKEALAKYTYRYFKNYLKPGRSLICIQKPPADVPMHGTFHYSYMPSGYITIAASCNGAEGLYSCRAGGSHEDVEVIKDSGINPFIKRFILSHVMFQGSIGEYTCDLYDMAVGPKAQPVLYTI